MKSRMGLRIATAALLGMLSACGSSVEATRNDAVEAVAEASVETVDTAELPDLRKDDIAGCPGECCDDGGCDDGNVCTIDRCDANACVHTPDPCDDANSCTTDTCDAESGCRHASIPACCIEGTADVLQTVSFDDDLEGVTIEAFGASAATPATWQPSTLKYHSTPQSLYFGIPGIGTYDNGKRVAARFQTPVVALPGNRRAELTFWLWLDVDPGEATDLFSVSAQTGGQRVPLFQKRADLIDRAWHEVTIDLTAFASRDVTLEFAFDSVNGAKNDLHGVYVDDLVVRSICTTPACSQANDCADDLTCTTEACDDEAARCAFSFDDGCCQNALDCRDADACTHDDCEAGACRWEAVTTPGCCNTDADCDDADVCTADDCFDAACRHLPSGIGGCCEVDADCDDGDSCTHDACIDGGCLLLPICCGSDADCDDGDPTCTADFCVEGACVYQPTGVAGCCVSEIAGLAFDDGSLGDLTIENSDDTVGWHVYGEAGTSSAPTPALYYGDSTDAASLSYDSGTTNHGTASLPLTLVPAGSKITLTFDLYLDVEESPDFDALTFTMVVDDTRYLVWDKTLLATTLVWHTYQVDLSAFAGLNGTLEVRFDTVDDTSNLGEGVYLDNLAVASSCTARACTNQADCDDGLAVTDERCLPNGQCAFALKSEPCSYDFECADADPCTADRCEAGFCAREALAGCCKETTECDDANACTVDTCDAANACRHPWTSGCCLGASDCDDADPCTADACPVAGQGCTHAGIEGCCTLNLDCDDGSPDTDDACTAAGCLHRPIACATTIDCTNDDPCTSGACLVGACAWLPVVSATCCQPLLLDVTFDDGTSGSFSLISSAHDVRWQLSSTQSNSTPFALHYGDPATGTYDNGAANWGRVVSDKVFLPVNTLLTFSFALWLDVESDPGRDPLDVILRTDLGPVVVWTRADQGGTARTWTQQQVDLTRFAGQAVQIEVSFATHDAVANTGEGLYLDDLRLTSSCAPAPCQGDADCASFDACAPAACVQGLCLAAPRAGCCAADAECDDGNACTVDTCPAVGDTCAHAWKQHCCLSVADCDDANPCTIDGCTAPGGICTNDAVEGCCLTNEDCGDHLAATLDLCLDSACQHKPAGCATTADCDDADTCTTAECLDGACAYLPAVQPDCCTPTLLEATFDQGGASPFSLTPDGWHVTDARHGSSAPRSLYFGIAFPDGATDAASADACDDADPCTVDHLEMATGTCAHDPAPDGAACDDDDADTANDTCVAGACLGIALAPPQVFRLDTLSLQAPEIVYDLGGGAAPINDLVSALLTARLDTFEFGGMIAVFDQLATPDAATVALGEGLCSFTDGVPAACGLTPLGHHATLQGVIASDVGACHDDAPFIAAPCFQTPEQLFDLGALIPELFSATEPVAGRAFGSFLGAPPGASGIENGVVVGFVPRAVASEVLISLGGTVITGDQVLAGVPLESRGGVEGWTVQIGFTAARVQHAAAPGTCGVEPEVCDDHDPGTTDLCREGTALCLNPERPTLPPAGSVADLLPRKGAAVSAPFTLPLSSEAWLSFSLFLDVEAGIERDPLLVRVLGGHGPFTVWDKLHLGPSDYRRWLRQEVDLTGFQGQTVRLELSFDTVDAVANHGEGVYLDDVRIETTCAPKACDSAAACPAPGPCHAAACVDGKCLTAPIPECCAQTADCNDGDVCTADACVDGTCTHERTAGCCGTNADCDDAVPCTADTCGADNACKHAFDLDCSSPLPYLQPFTGVSSLTTIGWTGRNQASGPGTNWKPTGAGAGFDQHLMFDDTPVVQNYAHRVLSPRLSAPSTTPLTFQWSAAFEAYSVAGTETTCLAEISNDDGVTWTTVWTATYKKTSAPVERHSVDVTADLGGSTHARVAFTVTGTTSYDILGWHIDDVRLLTGLPPVVDPIDDKTALVGNVTEILFLAADPEGQPVTARLVEPDAGWLHVEHRAGDLFALVADPSGDEFGGHQVTIALSDGQFEVERTFLLTVTSGRILLAENFDTEPTLAGLGWASSLDTGSVAHWGLTPTGGINGTPAARFDWYPVVSTFAETLISPTFDATSAGTDPLQFVFSHRLDLSSTFQGSLTAKVSSDNGATWAPVWTRDVNDALDVGPESVVVEVSEALAASPTARVAFTLAGKSTSPLSSWQIDTVRVLRGSAPEVTPVPPQTAVIGKTRDIVLHATDADGEALTFDLLAASPFLTLEPLGPNAAVVRATPTAADWGTHVVGVVVTDGLFSTRLEFTLTVQNEGETVLLHETFDTLPSLATGGWSIQLTTNPTSDPHWRLVAVSDLDDSGAAEFTWSPGVDDFDEMLVSPPIDASAIAGQSASLEFSHLLDVYAATNLTLALLVSADGGATWKEAWSHQTFDADGGVDVGPETVAVDLTPWLPGASDARFAFRIAGDDSRDLNGWYVDDVLLLGLTNP